FLFHFRKNFKDILFWGLFALQLVVYASIRLGIMLKFQNNPGEIIENHLFEHLQFIQARPFLVFAYLIYIVFMAIAVRKDWKKKPLFLREALLILTPTMLMLYLLGGYPFELRVFYEIYPIIFLLASSTFGQIIGFDFFAIQTEFPAELRPTSQ